MGIIDILRKRAITTTPDDDILIEAVKRGFGKNSKAGDSLMNLLNKEAKTMRKQDLRMWKNAVAAASDPTEPEYTALMELYDNILMDGHLMSVIDTRILKVQHSSFKLVDKAGKRNEEAEELLRDRWFIDFIRIAVMSYMKGATLLEMWEMEEDGTLKIVNEIPKQNVNFLTGHILKEPGSSTKWSYMEGIYQPYYMQIGNARDLGMLADIAPIVLAKKLAIGSWLDFIEKFGIPPRWVITDREDTGRLKELFEMMKNMISNHFAVLRGNERIELAPVPGTDAHQVFNQLIERMNSELSKRILGATGTTDEKSYVGAAQVHQAIANDRHEMDKTFIRNLINKDLFPKLVYISPAYSVLANLRFDWDYTEDLSAKDIIESVAKLGNQFEFDVEKLAAITGLPITGIKSYGTIEPGGNAEEGKKKA